MYQMLTLIGNLGSEPELRVTPTGTSVASFTLAVNKTWVTQDGEKKEKTTWFRITAWRKLAETAAQHLAKGRQILVVGEVEEASAWSDRDGNPRATIEVTATLIRFLGGKNGDHGGEDTLPEF